MKTNTGHIVVMPREEKVNNFICITSSGLVYIKPVVVLLVCSNGL